jgi:DNA-binding NtrC family response regulator
MRALRITLEGVESLTFSSSHDVGEGTLPAAGCVYVLLNKDVDGLTKFNEEIRDRGWKNENKGLAACLAGGGDGAQAIRTRFSTDARVLQGLHALLNRVGTGKDQRVCVVGVEQDAFETLCAQADARPNNDGDALPSRPEAVLSQELLHLLPNVEVPKVVRSAFLGNSLEAQLVRRLVVTVAKEKAPVMILGETGTGKEVIARAIHLESGRYGDIIPVNCAGIPNQLFESILFGYAPGVFTDGLKDGKDGLWLAANNGTVFLDEVGDIPMDCQGKVLRALQGNEIQPVGASKSLPVDARILSATNRDLFAMVQEGSFREDLYYRLRGVVIRPPALRHVREEMPGLIQKVWQRVTEDATASLPSDVVARLVDHPWPGNMRELKSFLTSLKMLFGTKDIALKHLHGLFHLHGLDHQCFDKAKPTLTAGSQFHRIECILHLRRASDVCRAAEVSLRPLRKGKKTMDATALTHLTGALAQHINELEMLCLHTLLFHSEETYSAVNQLKGKLTYLKSLLEENPASVPRFLARDLRPCFEQTSARIFEEVTVLE